MGISLSVVLPVVVLVFLYLLWGRYKLDLDKEATHEQMAYTPKLQTPGGSQNGSQLGFGPAPGVSMSDIDVDVEMANRTPGSAAYPNSPNAHSGMSYAPTTPSPLNANVNRSASSRTLHMHNSPTSRGTPVLLGQNGEPIEIHRSTSPHATAGMGGVGAGVAHKTKLKAWRRLFDVMDSDGDGQLS